MIIFVESLQRVGDVSASVLRLMPDADRAYPYEGSKSLMVVIDDVENTELMTEVLNGMDGELPEPRKKQSVMEQIKARIFGTDSI